MQTNSPVVHFPAQHASQLLMDLVNVARSLGRALPVQIEELSRYLPTDFQPEETSLSEIFDGIANLVATDKIAELGTIGGRAVIPILEGIAGAVIRRATNTLRDLNLMLDRGDSPVLVDKTQAWSRFARDLLCVKGILGCVSQPKRDVHGVTVYDAHGRVVRVKGLFLPKYVFETRQGANQPTGYLDGLERLNEKAGHMVEIQDVITQIRAITGRNGDHK